MQYIGAVKAVSTTAAVHCSGTATQHGGRTQEGAAAVRSRELHV